MHKFAIVLDVNGIFKHCIVARNLILCEKVPKHIVKESRRRSLIVSPKSPNERKGEKDVQRSHPDLFLVFREVDMISDDELFKETAQIFDYLNLGAWDLLMILLQLKLCESLIHIKFKHVFQFLQGLLI